MVDNVFLGVVGIDIDLYALNDLINSMAFQSQGLVCLLSNSGIIVTHPDSTWIEKNIAGLNLHETSSFADSLSKGAEFISESKSWFTQKKSIQYFYPINIESMGSPWYVMIEIPMDTVTLQARTFTFISTVFLVAFLILVMYMIFNFADRKANEKRLLENIHQLETTREELARHKFGLEILVKERTEELATTLEELQSINEELQSTNEQLNHKNETILQTNEELNQTLQNLKDTQLKLIHSEKMASLTP